MLGVGPRQSSSMGTDGETNYAGGDNRPPAFQVIVLGSGGGPVEDNVTGLLVRSTATKWSKGSVLAVDAGTHLAAVVNIIQEHLPAATANRGLDLVENRTNGHLNGGETNSPRLDATAPKLTLSTGPFAGLELHHTTAKANAAHIIRNLITTHLITHPHLDHISGFVINTAGFQHTSRPKRLAGLPSTIDAFKTHVFNDILWPNLSDEDGGVGLVSYMRLAEGGNIAIGEGEGRGYIEVCDSLAVKSWSISHGKCVNNHSKRGSGSGSNQEAFIDSFSRRPSQNVSTPGPSVSTHVGHPGAGVTDSTAFFLRDENSGDEILIFGDVEPDSLSLYPRTVQVWNEAAPKIAKNLLKAIFIECSYDESQSDETLFGHLAPRHVIKELQALAEKVELFKAGGDPAATALPVSNLAHAALPTSPGGEYSLSLKRKRISISSPSPLHQSEAAAMATAPAPLYADGINAVDPKNTKQPHHHRSHSSSAQTKTSPAQGRQQQQQHHRRTSSTQSQPQSKARKSARRSRNHESPGNNDDPGENEGEGDGINNSIMNSTDTGVAVAPSGPSTTTANDGPPLEGVQVVIIHVKDNLKDGPEIGETILAQLKEKEIEGGQGRLGCEFRISRAGEGIFL